MPYADSVAQAAAQARHYQANRGAYAERSRRARLRKRAKFDALKEGQPCADCGVSYPPRAMDYHHTDPSSKEASLGTLIHLGGWDRILAEIEKCVLLCANCHRLRH